MEWQNESTQQREEKEIEISTSGRNRVKKTAIIEINDLVKDRLSPINILIQGVNLNDGIGDYEHAIDYYMWCKEYFENANILLVSFLRWDKGDLAKILTPSKYHDDLISLEEKENLKDDINSKNIILYLGEWGINPTEINAVKVKKHVKALYEMFSSNELKKVDLVLNISTAALRLKNGFGDYYADSAKYSILEYGATAPPNKMFTEYSMGIKKNNQIGIKINENLHLLCTQSHEVKTENFATIENEKLLQYLTGSEGKQISKEDIDKYFEHTKICMGYLQKIGWMRDTKEYESNSEKVRFSSSRLFVSCMVNNPTITENLDIFVDKNYLNYLKANPDEINQLLQNSGSIEIYINGSVDYSLSNDTSGRKIRLVQFNGISNHDKEILLSNSEAVSASGDNSFSATIATQAFPYIIMPFGKDNVLRQLKELAQEKNYEILSTYIDLLRKFKANDEYFSFFNEFVYKNYEILKDEWKVICNIIYQEHNAKDYFEELSLQIHLKNAFDSPDQDIINDVVKILLQNDIEFPKILFNKENINKFILAIKENTQTILMKEPPNIDQLMLLKILGQSYGWKEILSHGKLLDIEITSFNNHIINLLSPILNPDIKVEKKDTSKSINDYKDLIPEKYHAQIKSIEFINKDICFNMSSPTIASAVQNHISELISTTNACSKRGLKVYVNQDAAEEYLNKPTPNSSFNNKRK